MIKNLFKVSAVLATMVLSATSVYAQTSEKLPESTKLSSVTGKAAELYSPTKDYSITDYPQVAVLTDAIDEVATPSEATPSDAENGNPLDFFIAQGNVTIERQYMSEFVDAILQTGDTYINVTPLVKWGSEDPDVIVADQGRLYAADAGSTVVTAEFLGKTIEIEVTVDEAYDFEGDSKDLLATPRIRGSRQESLDKAVKMIDVAWTPVKKFMGWRNTNGTEYWFNAGQQYKGIVYTQTDNMVDEDSFLAAMSKPDFYDIWTSSAGREMASYGNDCSGFVSIAWGQPRTGTVTMFDGIGTKYKKVGTYDKNKMLASELKTAYNLLQPGDAVVSSAKKHTFLIKSVNPGAQTVDVYEQTPGHAVRATWTYDNMAAGKYAPFTVFSTTTDGWVQENGNWYYYQNGSKLKGWQLISGEYYYLGTDGIMTTGWQMVDGVYYYMHSNGVMAHSEWIQDKNNGLWYYLHGNGAMAADEWIGSDSGEWYYVKPVGYMATNEWVDWTARDGYWYWVQEDGKMFRNGSLVINGVMRHFDANGRCTNP